MTVLVPFTLEVLLVLYLGGVSPKTNSGFRSYERLAREASSNGQGVSVNPAFSGELKAGTRRPQHQIGAGFEAAGSRSAEIRTVSGGRSVSSHSASARTSAQASPGFHREGFAMRRAGPPSCSEIDAIFQFRRCALPCGMAMCQVGDPALLLCAEVFSPSQASRVPLR